MRGFLSDLAVREPVAASSQNQTFIALLFFYRHVLHREFGQLDGVVRAKPHRYAPVVLSHAETEAVLGELQSPATSLLTSRALAVGSPYGCGGNAALATDLWRAGGGAALRANMRKDNHYESFGYTTNGKNRSGSVFLIKIWRML